MSSVAYIECPNCKTVMSAKAFDNGEPCWRCVAEALEKRLGEMPDPTTIKVGDVVRLPSGSPPMTVDFVGDKEVWCCWFNEENQCKRQTFLPGVLMLARALA